MSTSEIPARQWTAAPVGVARLPSAEARSDVLVYRGVSYCDAVRRAGEGELLRVLPGSIQVCRWSPVILGLKPPQGRFEQGLTPRLPFPTDGLLLGPLEGFPGSPELVIVRGQAHLLRAMVAAAGPAEMWDGHRGRLDRSALPFLAEEKASPRKGWIDRVNRLLAALSGRTGWQALTRWLFRSGLVTAGFDALISHTLADMSVCRNSTAIPLLSGRANLSLFCTGGITWGQNCPEHLTSGWPEPIYRRAGYLLEER